MSVILSEGREIDPDPSRRTRFFVWHSERSEIAVATASTHSHSLET